MNIFSFMTTLLQDLISVSNDVIDFLTRAYELPLDLGTFSVYQLIFGSALVILLGYLIIKALL